MFETVHLILGAFQTKGAREDYCETKGLCIPAVSVYKAQDAVKCRSDFY